MLKNGEDCGKIGLVKSEGGLGVTFFEAVSGVFVGPARPVEQPWVSPVRHGGTPEATKRLIIKSMKLPASDDWGYTTANWTNGGFPGRWVACVPGYYHGLESLGGTTVYEELHRCRGQYMCLLKYPIITQCFGSKQCWNSIQAFWPAHHFFRIFCYANLELLPDIYP